MSLGPQVERNVTLKAAANRKYILPMSLDRILTLICVKRYEFAAWKRKLNDHKVSQSRSQLLLRIEKRRICRQYDGRAHAHLEKLRHRIALFRPPKSIGSSPAWDQHAEHFHAQEAK